MIIWNEITKRWAARCPFPECLQKPDTEIQTIQDYTEACDELVKQGWQVKYYESIAICPDHRDISRRQNS